MADLRTKVGELIRHAANDPSSVNSIADSIVTAAGHQRLRLNVMDASVNICLMCFKQVPIVPGTRHHDRGGGPCLAMLAIEQVLDESLR